MTDAPIILAVDAARVLGWSYGRAGEPPISGAIECAKAGQHRAATFSGAGQWITRFVKAHPVDLLVIEAPFHASLQTNQQTADVLLGLPAVLEFMAYQFGVRRMERVNQSSVKKHFVAKGNGDQKAPIRRKCIALGWVTQDEADADKGFNRTDALAVWSYAEHQIAPKIAQPVDQLFAASMKRKRLAAEKAAEATRQPCLREETF